MKESTKAYLLTIAQVPVAMMLLGLACVQLCCAYIESRLKRLVFQPAIGPTDVGVDGIDSFMAWLASQEDDCVEWIRLVYEERPGIREIVGMHPDRKLYAVLRPTKEENLRLVEHVLRAWPPKYLRWMIDLMRRSATAFDLLKVSPPYDNKGCAVNK